MGVSTFDTSISIAWRGVWVPEPLKLNIIFPVLFHRPCEQRKEQRRVSTRGPFYKFYARTKNLRTLDLGFRV